MQLFVSIYSQLSPPTSHPPAFTWYECSSSITVYYSIADVNRRIKRRRFDNKITKEALPAGSQPKDVATVVCEATQLQGVWSGSKLTPKHTSTTSGCLVRFKAHYSVRNSLFFLPDRIAGNWKQAAQVKSSSLMSQVTRCGYLLEHIFNFPYVLFNVIVSGQGFEII